MEITDLTLDMLVTQGGGGLMYFYLIKRVGRTTAFRPRLTVETM